MEFPAQVWCCGVWVCPVAFLLFEKPVELLWSPAVRPHKFAHDVIADYNKTFNSGGVGVVWGRGAEWRISLLISARGNAYFASF